MIFSVQAILVLGFVVLLFDPGLCFSVVSSLNIDAWESRRVTRISSLEREECESTTKMEFISGIDDIVDKFDTFLLDMWGVMHDGSAPYEGVLEVVKKLREADKKLVILSNSSKRRDNSVKMLKKLGFDPEDFHQIITSGEVAYGMMSGEIQKLWSLLDDLQNDNDKKKVFVFGSGDQDEEYCESSGWKLVPMDEANLIVARGTFTVNDGVASVSKRNNAEAYEAALEEQLRRAAARQIPMLVTNPDKVRPDAERPPMPGKIGDQYEEMLRKALSVDDAKALVKRVGKPFEDVYNLAVNDNDEASRSRTCMVGDALETDIVGALASRVSSVWVLLDGIHGPDLSAGKDLVSSAHKVVEEFNSKEGTYAGTRKVMPDIVLRHFRW